jgi:hypothetical protein
MPPSIVSTDAVPASGSAGEGPSGTTQNNRGQSPINGRLSPKVARFLTPFLFVLGVQAWLILGGGNYGHNHQPLLLFIALVLGLLPPVSRLVNHLWISVAHPSTKAKLVTALVLLVISPIYLYAVQRREGFAIVPTYQDEFSYLIQMRMLQHGRLLMPQHPCADFFDTFYMFVKPVYASMYFPGAAMMFVPALWLHLPWFVGPLAASGLCVALVYLTLAEVLDGASGILGVLMLVSIGVFRMISTMAMANAPALALGLAMTYAALRWIATGRTRWLLLLGFAAGWSAITRPVDGLCFAIATGSAIALHLGLRNPRLWIKTIAAIVLPALPFLLFQLWLNHKIVGDWFKSPFGLYTDLYYPGAFSFYHNFLPQHVSNLTQKQYFYDSFAKPVIESHLLSTLFTNTGVLVGDLAFITHFAIIDPFIWLIAPFSLLAMWKRSYWIVWAIIPLSLMILSTYAFSTVLPQHFVFTFPAAILLCLLPIRFLTETFPNYSAMIRTVLSLGIVFLCCASMPWFDPIQMDHFFVPMELKAIDQTLSTDVAAPAVVMFHFNRDTLIDGKRVTDNPSEEPVFNSDVSWPDDAPIIRAQDLNPSVASVGKPGDADLPLYEYYARTAPNRVFYLFDRAGGNGKLSRLGTAGDLIRAVSEEGFFATDGKSDRHR